MPASSISYLYVGSTIRVDYFNSLRSLRVTPLPLSKPIRGRVPVPSMLEAHLLAEGRRLTLYMGF